MREWREVAVRGAGPCVGAAVRGGPAAPESGGRGTQGSAHRPRFASADWLHPGLLSCLALSGLARLTRR